MKTPNKFTLLTGSASILKDNVKTIALFLEVSKVLTASNINTLAALEKSSLSPKPVYDGLFSFYVGLSLGYEELSNDCQTWFEENGFPLDDEELG